MRFSKNMLSSQYDIVSLNKVLKSKPQYGANESGIARNSLLAPRYIRITDINESGLLIDSMGVSASLVEDKYVLNDKDILFARSGATVGKSYLHHANRQDYKCFFAGYMIRFVINSKLALPEYVFLYSQLPTYANWVKYIQRAVGQPNINAEEFKSLLLPLPPIEDQRRIVDIFNAAYQQKQEKETQAKQLLAGIDDYLLSELGITLPEQDNSLNKRIFTTKFSKLTGSRFDPIFLKNSINLLLAGIYKSDLLRSVAISFKSGVGAGKQDQSLDDNGIIQIRPTNLGVNGELKFDKNVYLPSFGNYSSNDFAIHLDVLFNNTNSQELVGKTAVLSLSKKFLFSNHITRIRVNTEKLNPNYLSLILNLYQSCNVFYSICTNWNNQSGIGLEILKNIKIPVPPLEKQQEISAKISKIRQEAKRLQEDGANILANAKIQVEQMILGN